MRKKYLTIGRIDSPHGLKGEVKVTALTDYPERFSSNLKVYLAPPLSHFPFLTIESSRQSKSKILLKFKEINHISEAEKLKKHFLQIPIEESVSLSPGSFWIHQIIGLKCYSENGKFLGKIKDVLRTGSNDVYLTSLRKNDKILELLIPATKEVVVEINLKEGKIVVKPIPGLLPEGFDDEN